MDLDLDGLTEKLGGMAGKYGVGKPAGMSDDVYKIYIERLGKEALNLRQVGNDIETKQIKGSGVEAQWGQLEKLSKTNTAVARAMVGFYETKGAAGYEKILSSLAGNMARDKDFANKFVIEAEKNPAKTLSDYQAALEVNGPQAPHALTNYMNGLTGKPLVSTSPTASASTTVPASSVPAQKRKTITPPVAAANARAAAGSASTPSAGTPLNPLDAFLAQNAAFAGLVNGTPDLKGKIEGAVKENPELMDKFYDPGQMARYTDILKDKTKKPAEISAAFMAAFAPPPVETSLSSLLGLDDKGMGGLKSILDMFGLGGGVVGKFLGGAMDLFEKWGGAMQGPGYTLAIYMKNNDGLTPDDLYLSETTRANVANLHHADPRVVRESERYLKEFAGKSPENKKLVDRLLDGEDVGVSHVSFEERKNKDGKMERVPVLHETTYGGMMAQVKKDADAYHAPSRAMAEARAKAEAEEAIQRGLASAKVTEEMRQGQKVAMPNEPSLIPSGSTATT